MRSTSNLPISWRSTTASFNKKVDQRKEVLVPCKRNSLSKEFSTLTLGARLENTKTGETESLNTNHLYAVCCTTFFCFAFVNLLCYFVTSYGLSEPAIKGPVSESMKRPLDSPDAQVVRFFDGWYQQQIDAGMNPLSLQNDSRSSSSPECLNKIQKGLQSHLSVSSPEAFESILQEMGLDDRPVIRDQLKTWLRFPQSINPVLESLFGCISSSETLPELICTLMDATSSKNETSVNDALLMQLSTLNDILHRAIILDELTLAMMENLAILHDVIEVMTTTQRIRQQAYFNNYFPATVSQTLAKEYAETATALEYVASAITENKPVPLRRALQLQILRAARHDVQAKREDNAHVGIALASAVHFEPTFIDHKLHWPLGPQWVDAYMAWRVGVDGNNGKDTTVSTLLASVGVCPSSASSHEETFVLLQIVRQALEQMMLPIPESDDGSLVNDFDNDTMVNIVGEINSKTVRLSSPTSESFQKLLDDLCTETHCQNQEPENWQTTDTVPTASLDDEQFQVYVGFILWFTVLFAGLGLELLTWTSFLQGGWTDERQSQWMFAQFSFPLLLATTLGLAFHRNFLALICLVPGLWKFGFPETLVYMHTALYGEYLHETEGHAGTIQRLSEFLNAVGTVVHHGAAALVICMLLAGVIPPSRHIYSPSLILVMQHWFVLLRYGNKVLYTVIELSLEVFFEWTVLSEFEYLMAMHWCVPMAASTMLVAHWLYLVAAFVETVKPTNDENNNRRESSRTQETKESLYQSLRSIGLAEMSDPFHQEEDSQTKKEQQQEAADLMCSLNSLALEDIQEMSHCNDDSSCNSTNSFDLDPTEDPTEEPTDRNNDICIDFREIKLLDLAQLQNSQQSDVSFVIGGSRTIDV